MDLSTPMLLGVLLFVWTVWAVLFWGSIALIERYNPYNKFKWALLWSAAEIGVSIAIGNLGFGGLGLLLAWLGFLIRLLLNSYELGLLHAIGVIIVTVVGPYFVFDAFDTVLAFVGSSETAFMILLYSVPAAIFAVWLWPRPAPSQPTNLPPARIEKLGRKRPPTAPAFTAAPAPAPAPLRAAPIAAPAPVASSPAASPRLISPAPAATAPAPIPPPAPVVTAPATFRAAPPLAAPSPLAPPAAGLLAAPAPSALPSPAASPSSALPTPAAAPSRVPPASPALPAASPISSPSPDSPRDVGEPSFLR